MTDKPSKKPFSMVLRVLRLLLFGGNPTDALVNRSYDRISTGYDAAWTNHMRDRTKELIDLVNPKPGARAIDLTCGTGYATSLLAKRTQTKVIGVDRSGGMLQQARDHYDSDCEFVQADILDYLRTVPSRSQDVVSCCWGSGYSSPLAVLREIKRVLKSDGKAGLIDNTLFSLFEVLYCSFLAFMEQPDKLRNIMRFRFLMHRHQLALWFRLAGLKPKQMWSGSKSYSVSSGAEAIDRLRATGAAAGFEYAGDLDSEQEIFSRFAEILEKKYLRDGRIEIIHRYLGGIAVK